VTELDGPRIPGPGVLLWAKGREELADPVDPETLTGVHPVWEKDARQLAPWQEVSVPWCSTCETERWWRSAGQGRSTTIVCGPCTSVLDVAWPMAVNGMLTPWDCVAAVSQWSGRGQLRRAWESPPGNLYMALALPAVPRELDTLAPLMLGYCLASYFRGRGVEACLKWPNDLIVGGVKVGGVLVEERKGIVLAGVGINICSHPPRELLREDHAVPAGCLEASGLAATPLGLCLDLVEFVRTCYETTLVQGAPEEVVSLVEPLLCWVGQDVTVREGVAPPWTARILGLAKDGALRVAPAGGAGERLLTSGSIWRVS